jgi:hypothetical protein
MLRNELVREIGPGVLPLCVVLIRHDSVRVCEMRRSRKEIRSRTSGLVYLIQVGSLLHSPSCRCSVLDMKCSFCYVMTGLCECDCIYMVCILAWHIRILPPLS